MFILHSQVVFANLVAYFIPTYMKSPPYRKLFCFVLFLQIKTMFTKVVYDHDNGEKQAD